MVYLEFSLIHDLEIDKTFASVFIDEVLFDFFR